ncbi:hypothetical protein ACFSM7_10030 [Clavibacter michiganensis subsp. tessellarius]|uniref:hypothetical protein n=1 Tax=Clavibacter tessellarius TaxID=31965 RepID=UPI003632C85B
MEDLSWWTAPRRIRPRLFSRRAFAAAAGAAYPLDRSPAGRPGRGGSARAASRVAAPAPPPQDRLITTRGSPSRTMPHATAGLA